MALQSQIKTDNLNEGKNEQSNENQIKNQGSIQNGTTENTSATAYNNKSGAMSEQKAKSPNGNSAAGVIEHQLAPYGDPHHVAHGHPEHHIPPPHPPQGPPLHGIKEDLPPGAVPPHQQPPMSPYGPPPPMHQQYPRYHHDPNMPPGDPYAHYRQLPPGGKPGAMPSNRPPPQRYMPGPHPPGPMPPGPPGQQQGPTPTLNSLLQSQPPPHRYPNSYDPNSQQPPQHSGPPTGPGQTGYGQAGAWSQPQPPRPYSPQMGPQQPYRPPTGNPPRGQSPYPPAPNQQPPPGAYPPGPPNQPPQSQSPGGPPPPSQYPYPQRYPTPPATQQAPNHRSAYPPHQYPEPNRTWPSPAASPGPGGLPPPSPHGPPPSPSQAHHGAPCPSPQPSQSAPSPHQYPSRPSQSSTPVTNDTDTIGDTTGQNSNDSSSGAGAAPGTPNSQGMRPTPSPTGSSGSRSMSPAIGQQSSQMPPRPSSSHSQQNPAANSNTNSVSNQQIQTPLDTSIGSPGRPPPSSNPTVPPSSAPPPNSSMAAQGSYQAQPPHMHGYKPGPQGMSPYPPSQQYSQPNYPSRGPYPGQYGPGGQPPPPNSMSPGQYPGRPMPNHVAQYPPYQQNWGPPQAPPPQSAMMSNHVQQQGKPGGSPRQGNYLKQHLKSGYPAPGQPVTPPQGYGNGPGMPPPMGPPHHMGPPIMGPPPPTTVPPSQPANNHPEGMPHSDSQPPQDNGVPQGSHPVTSVVTTGPDGASLDEASQQSTLSNASAASGEDPQCSTPKARKTDSSTPGPNPYQNQNHLPPPTPSPGAPHHGDDYEMGSSPQWQGRTPAASPVFNTHVPQEPYRSPKVSTKVSRKKSDSIAKLYDMDDNPERKGWLDKLITFMEDRRTPISACPTISKQALDLYRLYLYVKERGGFVEVCKVSKSKTWKDVAGLLGIGASSSAAYTLRKHYTKNILPFECQFDRGGIDPGPIAQSIETGSKKKAAKAASVPSPGSSNSQDSFPPPGSSGGSMDGYAQPYPGQQGPPPPPTSYPAQPGPTPEYNQQPMPRPPSQSNAQVPHSGTGAPPPAATGDNISASNPFDDPVGPPRPPYQQGAPYSPVSRPQGTPYQQPQQPGYSQYSGPEGYGPPPSGPPPPGQYPSQGQFPPPQGRQMYPGPYGSGPPPPTSEGESNAPPPTSGALPASTDPYRSGYPPQSAQGPYPIPPGPPRAYPPPQQQPPVSVAPTSTPQTGPGIQQTPPAVQSAPPPGSYSQGPPPQSDYYRQPEPSGQPRRHPDFAKEPQPYPGYGASPQRPQMYAGWPPNNQGQYPRGPSGPYPPQQGPPGWQTSGPRPSGPPVPQPQGGPGPQWGTDRFPPNQQPPYPHQANQPQWGPQGPPGSQMRAPMRGGKPFNMPPPQGAKPVPGPYQQPGVLPKREIVFPPDSIESTTPIMMRRKRLCRGDIGVTDPWRIFMALRSGLLHETTWALDVLSILLFDDTAIAYFGLNHMPGLLNLLLEHFQKSLFDVFEPTFGKENKNTWYTFKRPLKDDDEQAKQELAKQLGAVTELPRAEDRVEILRNSTNYTMTSRKGLPVKMNSGDDDIFVTDDIRMWDRVSDPKYQSTTTIGCDAWSAGQTDPDPYDYIMDTFAGEFVNIPFAKFIKNSKKTIKKEVAEEASKKTVNVTNPSKTKVLEESPVEIVKKTISKMNKENNRIIQNNLMVEPKKENGEIKRESSDADLRQIDMELDERIPNGPTSNGSGEKKEEMMETEEEKGFDIIVTARDPAKVLKRRRISECEDECYTRDDASLYLVTETQDVVARRCISLSNILRNFTFVPGNELEFARSQAFLAILGKLLLFHHDHLVRTKKTRNYDREEDADFTDSCSSLQGENEWWWDYLIQIRENMLVATANIAGHMDLSSYDEDISRPVLDGLLHWAVCPAAHGQDPFPTCGPHSNLSPQRLALEALCKLCVTDANVDLVIATPPFSRLEKLCAVLTRHLCKNEDQVLREFSVNLLHYLAAADSTMARTIAMQSPCVSYLVAFIEQAEQTALGVANQHGINFLRENPDSMGTSLDMLRRSAGTLLHLARHPDNRPLFMQQEQRLLGLVMSHILDQQVASIISRVLFQCSRGPGPLTTAELLHSQRPSTTTITKPTTTSTLTSPAAITAATVTLSPNPIHHEAQVVQVAKEDLSSPPSTEKITTLGKSVTTAPSLQREPVVAGSS